MISWRKEGMPAVVVFAVVALALVVAVVAAALATAMSSGATVLWRERPAFHDVADPVRWRVGVDIE
jgi:hypothetical protein